VVCELCGRKVAVTHPRPADYLNDTWPDSKDPRVAVHWFVTKSPPQ
jgi:hypothetical protein